jgi:hypothetical protein
MRIRQTTQPLLLMNPWIRATYNQLRGVDFPDCCGPTLYVTSDYSDQNKQQSYDVIAILLLDPDRSPAWPAAIRRVRQEFLSDGRRMAFKNLNDTRRQRAFFPFLDAANELHGACIAVAIEKTVPRIWTTPETLTTWGETLVAARWTDYQFERLMRIAGFLAMFIAGLSSRDQDIIWISDQDNLFANETFANDTGRMLARLLPLFLQHSVGQLMIGTTAIDPGDRGEEDLAAISDLVAGASAELLTRMKEHYGKIPSGIITDLPQMPTKTDKFFEWFADHSHPLKRVGIVFGNDGAGKNSVGLWSVHELPSNMSGLYLPGDGS